MVRSFRWVVATLMVGAVVAVTGCSGDDSADPTSQTRATATTASDTTSSTTTSPTSDHAVGAAVQSFWQMFIEVGGRPGPFDAGATRAALSAHATGDELRQLYNAFQVNAIRGQVIRGEIDNAPKVITNDGRTAQVRDCYDDRTGVYRVSDGARVDKDDPARKLVVMTVQFESGTWKVAAIRHEGTGCSV